MRYLAGVGIAILLLTSCGHDDTVRVEATATTSTTVYERIDAPPTPKEVDAGALYLRLVHADRASRSGKRTTDTTSPKRVGTQGHTNSSAKGSKDSGTRDSGTVRGSDEIWSKLGACESGNNPTSVSADGKYWGAFQFSLATWKSLGEQGTPTSYSYAYQLGVAQRLQARSGWGQWPRCARRLGLR